MEALSWGFRAVVLAGAVGIAAIVLALGGGMAVYIFRSLIGHYDKGGKGDG